MIMHRNDIFKMTLSSIKNTTDDWEVNSHGIDPERKLTTVYDISNREIDINIWTANGLPFIEISSNSRNKPIRINILQSILLHIAYLNKIRKYPKCLIFFRYLSYGCLGFGFFSLILIYLNNYKGVKKSELKIKKVKYRDIIIDKILNNK